ncbi:MAG: hypothetical protein COU35_05295 [Candidatus Magasanikbacteria bacterium CG10_big_fil_rev_8_21_14_0_10_47_10]|uniref:Lipoprotein n=1 Tax=Candidatus Magasanikbacteria bacterium CG10_big_fil_rev_8_21_14_0_10_47_10 TaxID=1974652 RepID=A0A2H0TP27_9BACT|nr:MAG: hypothetical protein COU35_05295 [Candidatus Magasanikbacteria bacterium CG10_big_fil_rev_8_21_14_0_10_47_10]
MKKYLLLPVTLLLLGSGCAKQQITQNTISQSSTNTQVEVSSSENIHSPLSALLDHLQIGNPNGEYARLTNIRIQSDAEAGFNPSSFTVTYTEDGIADDEIRKEEYQLKLKKEADGNWKVTDKKLVHRECYEGRGCE